ncbi:S-layer homology domain-containing protein [Bacillus tuaregi]|uniref:S-layer homology domain-containing protein n=1 Tax=Bacillus tuaregi TaxID=1816695 RepID=UPI0008F8C023|nr:S-layer homology domain-containing protein [Bacillus tuaregi]
MRRKRTNLSLSLAIALSLLIAPVASAEGADTKVDYLALGDSLAAGQSYDKTIGKGYTDYLGSQLSKIGVLSSFTKQFAVSGYTTTQILNDIESNIVKNGVSIQDEIKNAEIITIDAGANDLLQLIEIDREELKVTYDQEELTAGITTVGQNLTSIFAKIKALNPTAEIYVMGYYNPFPILPSPYKEQFVPLLDALNQVIANVSKPFGATFVPTADSIAKNALGYLPNIQDIHPNQAGYLAIANDFWKAINVKKQASFNDDIPEVAKEEIEYLVEKGIIAGYVNGNFGPNDLITRVQSAIMLNRAIVYSDDSAPNPNYTDVNDHTFGYDVIAKMTEAGVFAGNNQLFNPGNPLTRAEMAKVLVQAFELKGTGARSFNDVSSDYWAAAYISTLAENGITIGYNDGSFKPNDYITRAEFSIMLSRALNDSFK